MNDLKLQLASLKGEVAAKEQSISAQENLLQERMSAAADKLSRELDDAKVEYYNDFLMTQQECVRQFQSEIDSWAQKTQSVKQELKRL